MPFATADGANFEDLSVKYAINIESNISVSLLTPVGFVGYLGMMNELLATFGTASPNETFMFKSSQTLLNSLSMLYPDPSYALKTTTVESTPINAMECGYWCAPMCTVLPWRVVQ